MLPCTHRGRRSRHCRQHRHICRKQQSDCDHAHQRGHHHGHGPGPSPYLPLLAPLDGVAYGLCMVRRVAVANEVCRRGGSEWVEMS
eukprot:1871838-Prymnesium_polylepis.1